MPRKFAPRAPKRRATAVKVEAPAPAIAPEAPEPEQASSSRGRLRRHTAAATGSAFFETTPPPRPERPQRGAARSVKVKKEPEDVVMTHVKFEDDDDDDVDMHSDDDPLAPVRLVASVPKKEEGDVFGDGDGFYVVQFPTQLPAGLKRRAVEDEDYDALAKLEPGHIGTLQILKSGRTRLKLGGEIFDVDRGLDCAMRQQIAAVDDDALTILGDVTTKVLVTITDNEGVSESHRT